MRRVFKKKDKGQTILEYGLLVLVVIVPVALTLRGLLSDQDEDRPSNLVSEVTSTSYGDRERFGTIGRPYP